jgi:hypothetical protein
LGGGERERLEEKNDCWEREDGHGDEVMELAAATSECQVGDGVGWEKRLSEIEQPAVPHRSIYTSNLKQLGSTTQIRDLHNGSNLSRVVRCGLECEASHTLVPNWAEI